MIAIIMHICNNKKVMGENTNKRWPNVLGSVTLILMSAAAAALIYFQFK
jgi:Mn2+/Fe2+ NRAMP family transporter